MWVLGYVHCHVVCMTKNISGKSFFFSSQYVLGYINKKGLNNELFPGRISHHELVAHPTIVALYTPIGLNCLSIVGLSFWIVLLFR